MAPPSQLLVLLVLLAIASPLGFFIYSVTGPKIMVARYMCASLPAVILVVAALLTSLPRSLSVVSSTVVAGVLLIGALMSLDSEHGRPAYKEVAISSMQGPSRPMPSSLQADRSA